LGQVVVSRWALKHYKPLAEETILAVMDELEAGIAGANKPHIFSSPEEAYALASRFKNALYRYQFFKKKHLRILRAIIDRCGEAYHYKDTTKLYISKNVVEEWSRDFEIPPDRIQEYLAPLTTFGILEHSDRPDHIYRVSNRFFQLVGPVAQHIVMPVDTRRFTDMMAVVSGAASVYVIATAVKSRGNVVSSGPLIPWFLKLPMIYTLSGLVPGTTKIRDVLELARINAVDNYFVKERGAPVEWWRSIRTEAFEFMADNNIIEHAVSNGYKLSTPWVRVNEEGVKRYVRRLRERYERIYRGP